MDSKENHTTPELAPVIRYCEACLSNRTRNIYGRCIVCNSDLTNARFIETVGILQDLITEVTYLESVKQCAKDLIDLREKINEHKEPFNFGAKWTAKLNELKHLVDTD